MKTIAILLNVALLASMTYVLATSNGSPTGKELVTVVLIFAAPLFSLLALLRVGDESWLGLFLKRKALEERKRISQLESMTGP